MKYYNCVNVGNEEKKDNKNQKQEQIMLYLSRGFGLAGKRVNNTLPLILAGLGPITVTQSTTNNNEQKIPKLREYKKLEE